MGILDWLAKLLPGKKASEITAPGSVSAQSAALNIQYHQYLNACATLGVSPPFTIDQWVNAGKPTSIGAAAAAHGVKASGM